jgi:hypothetical protein
MPGSATTYLEQAVLSHTLAIGAMGFPTGLFVGLCAASAPPTAGTGGTEIAGGAYARLPATFALDTTPPNAASNTATLEWLPATAAWGLVGWFELWTALTGGTRFYWGPLVDPSDGVTPIVRSVQTGDIMRIQAGALQVSAF